MPLKHMRIRFQSLSEIGKPPLQPPAKIFQEPGPGVAAISLLSVRSTLCQMSVPLRRAVGFIGLYSFAVVWSRSMICIHWPNVPIEPIQDFAHDVLQRGEMACIELDMPLVAFRGTEQPEHRLL